MPKRRQCQSVCAAAGDLQQQGHMWKVPPSWIPWGPQESGLQVCYLHCAHSFWAASCCGVRAGVAVLVLPCLAVGKALQKAVRCLVTHLLSFLLLLQLSMLFTEECDKVRDLMHVHSFSYDFHLRIVHQYLLGSHMTLRQGYHLTSFLEDFIAHHTDIPKFGRNHVFQGE